MKNVIIVCERADTLVPTGLRALLEKAARFDSVQVATFEEMKEIQGPGSLLILFGDKDHKGAIIESVRELRSRRGDSPVLVVDLDVLSAATIKTLLRIPKTGIVSVSCPVEEIFSSISKLQEGKMTLCSIIQEKLVTSILEQSDQVKAGGFTKKEQAIIDAACEGQSIRQTADEMNLSPSTVAVYRSKILKKAGVKTFTQFLAAYR